MSFACPVCETVSEASTAECPVCGRRLIDGPLEVPELPPPEGLEDTLLERPEERNPAVGDVPLLPDLVETLARGHALEVPVEPLEVERSAQELLGPAQRFWMDGLDELDSGRESDGFAATPAPVDTGLCAWCGNAGTGLVCDHCGRRRFHGRPPPAPGEGPVRTAAQRAAFEADTLLCPSCFSRVPRAGRCPECMSPLPGGEFH